jgi:hypothetical protein
MFGSRRTRKGALGRTGAGVVCPEFKRAGGTGPMASPLSPSTRRRASSVETHANQITKSHLRSITSYRKSDLASAACTAQTSVYIE